MDEKEEGKRQHSSCCEDSSVVTTTTTTKQQPKEKSGEDNDDHVNNNNNNNNNQTNNKKRRRTPPPASAPSTATTTTATTISSGRSGGSGTNSTNRRRRSVCQRCDRPSVTCLCSSLPERPIELKRCHCLVLQHPHELHRKNRSLPIIELCLHPNSLSVLVSRRLYNNQERHKRDPKVLELLDRLQQQPPPNSKHHPVWLIYPHPDAIPLRQAIRQHFHHRSQSPPPTSKNDDDNSSSNNLHQQKTTDVLPPAPAPVVTLLFLDATWKYAREMNSYHEARDNMYPRQMLRVKLDSNDLSDLKIKRRFAIRTPKSDEHLSTAECLAYTISRIEEERGDDENNASSLVSCSGGKIDSNGTNNDNNNNNNNNKNDESSIYQTIMKPLDYMVEQWKSFQQRKKK